MLGISLNQMAVVHIVKCEAFDDCQAAMVLIGIENFFELLLPVFCFNAHLEHILKFLGAKNSQGFDQGIFAASWYGWVLLLNFLCVQNFCDTILNNFLCRLECRHVSVGSSKFDVIQNPPVKVLDSRQYKVVVQA